MCDAVGVTLINKSGRNWPRNTENRGIFFPFFLGYNLFPILECASLYYINVVITNNC